MQERIDYLIAEYINKKSGETTMEYIWYKLKDDTWGVKIKNGTGVAGQEIKVTNKAGKESTVVLAVQKAKFDDAELWAIKR